MKLSELANPSRALLVEQGFSALKPHSFVRSRNGVFQYLTFQAQGHDLYIWHNSLPISMPDINASAGWRNAAGRCPAQKEPLASPADDLLGFLGSVALPRLDFLSELGILAEEFSESNLFAYYPRAFCYLQLERYDDGRNALRRFLTDPIERQVMSLARSYIEADDLSIPEMLHHESLRNLGRHKLVSQKATSPLERE